MKTLKKFLVYQKFIYTDNGPRGKKRKLNKQLGILTVIGL